MILEYARLTIDPADADAFEAAVAQCAPLFRDAQGCGGMRLEREIESDRHYILRVHWRSVEDHMETFRESTGFTSWREAVSPFFRAPPAVTHSHLVDEFF